MFYAKGKVNSLKLVLIKNYMYKRRKSVDQCYFSIVIFFVSKYVLCNVGT